MTALILGVFMVAAVAAMPIAHALLVAAMAAAATMASMAVPPAASTSRPARAAMRWGAVMAPLWPRAVCSMAISFAGTKSLAAGDDPDN